MKSLINFSFCVVQDFDYFIKSGLKPIQASITNTNSRCVQDRLRVSLPPVKLRVRATPNARRSEVIGWENDAQAGKILHVRVAAPPVEGKANDALRNFLAQSLGLAKSKVLLEKGGSSRFKSFEIPDGTNLPW